MNSISPFHSDRIRDSVFEDVIKITDQHLVTRGGDYLLDMPIPASDEIPIIHISTEVPLSLLSTIYPEFPRIIIIIPNWPYINNVTYEADGIICSEPLTSLILYDFKREDGRLRQDSLVILGDYIDMNFSSVRDLQSDEVKVYYKEVFGGKCCPRDPQWDNTPKREDFVNHFEEANHVKMSDTYVKYRGREGESEYYYTLEGWTAELKLVFIQERNFSRIINRENKDIKKAPKIYTPRVTQITSKMKLL